MLPLVLALAAAPPEPELGLVPWRRGFDEARVESARSHTPMLVLFDEVPGCSTVNEYADEVLRDPFVVDASALFVSVFVSNNEPGANGADARTLAQFDEPAWNNPVVRLVDADGRTLARLTHDAGRAGLLRAMVSALEHAKRDVPPWLRVVADEGGASTTKAFACSCFWEGEGALGKVDGVRTTEAGFVDGREVVRVRVDPSRARAVDVAAGALGYRAVDGEFTMAKRDDKYRLRGTRWDIASLTPGQRTRINAALANGDDPTPLLAPFQRGLSP